MRCVGFVRRECARRDAEQGNVVGVSAERCDVVAYLAQGGGLIQEPRIGNHIVAKQFGQIQESQGAKPVVDGHHDNVVLPHTLFMHARWLASGNTAEIFVGPGGLHGFTVFPTELGVAALERANEFMDGYL